MILEILLAILLGVILGIFTGITPGIHINLVSVLIITFSPVLLSFIPPIILAIAIVSMSITHTFLDALPSVYLGAPDESQVLSVLPGHRLLLQGKGHEAIVLTAIGALGSLILVIILAPILMPLVEKAYPFISKFIAYILIFTSAFMIFREKKRLLALILFLLAGCLGLAVFNLGMKDPLLPLLSGLFGISGLLLSINDNVKIPNQVFSYPSVGKKTAVKAFSATVFAGTLTSFLPGFSSAQASILGANIAGDIGDKGYLILSSGSNTVNMVLSVVALYIINKARNGSIIAVSKLIGTLTLENLMIMLAVALVAAGIATFLVLKLSKVFSKMISKVNYKVLCISIICFIMALCLFLTGFMGLFILVVSTSIGLIAPLNNFGRNHAMGCLIIPVIFYFLL